MKARSAMTAAIMSVFCLAAGSAFAHQGGASGCQGAGHVNSAVNYSIHGQMVEPRFTLPGHCSPRAFASAFEAAYRAPPIAVLKSHEGKANIVLSNVPVHACRTGAHAAFALNGQGEVVYGCETSSEGHFSVCWKGYGCHRYQSSKWDRVALTKPAAPMSPSRL